jgi:alpha-glucosidase
MLKTLLLSGLLATSALAIEIDGLEPIGPYQSETQQSILCQDGSQLKIQFLAPDLVRVRVSYRQALDPTGNPSWAIAKKVWAAVAVTRSETPDRLTFSSSEVKVVVHKNPLLVEFQDKNGATLNRDHLPVLGDPKQTKQSRLFDPKAGSMTMVTKSLGLEEHFYALGEKAHKLDLRRGHFSMWNSDTPAYAEGKDPIYQSIPFYIGLQEGRAYGLFYDNSYRSHFDFGHTQQEWAGYAVEGGEIDYYFFQGPSIKKVVQRYTDLTGRIYLPPKWALGHQASRWSYYPDKLVEKIADTYQQHDLPLDVMTLDIHYMQKYRVFTWDRLRFPDPAGMIARLKAKGLHTVTIVDPGVKYQPEGQGPDPVDKPELRDQSKSYYVFNQGVKNGYFVKRQDGSLMVTKVWPGDTVFVDYTMDKARQWWGDLHRAYLDQGVEGIWNDMNEPADFTDQSGGHQRDSVFEDRGQRTAHAKNRNLVALLMSKATYEGLLRLQPNVRPYVITRAAYAGIQRYATMWTGDAPSTWESLALSVPMLCNLGLSGESFIGSDVGGFMGRGDGEMLVRAYQISFLLPFCRNHKEHGGYDQEPWRFGPYYESIIRNYLKLRYRLLPYLYAGIEEAHSTGIPFIRPLVLEYQDDPHTYSMDDQFLAGRDLLCAPVTRPGQESRRVYLPEGRWYDFYSGHPTPGGRVKKVEAPLNTVPLFVRAGAIVPMGPEKNTVEAMPHEPLQLNVYPTANNTAETTLYEDDGRTQEYLRGQQARRKVTYKNHQVTIAATPYSLPERKLHFRFFSNARLTRAHWDGQPVALRRTANYLEVTVPDSNQAHQMRLE